MTDPLEKSFKKYIRTVIFILLASLLAFILSNIFQEKFGIAMGVTSYLTWHVLFEFTSIIISISIFFIAFFTYDQTRNLRSIIMGCLFFIIGIVDFFHTFSYSGMAELFINTGSANFATTFWVIARLISAIGFFIVFSIDEKKKVWTHKKVFFLPAVGFCILIFYLVAIQSNILPIMFDPVTGLSLIKKILEYIIMGLFLITIVKNFIKFSKTMNEVYAIFALGLLLAVIGEFSFVLYKNDVYNIFNYLGHIFKVISFMFMFNAIFIHDVKKPYEDLKNTRDELSVYADNLDRIVDTRTRMLKYTNAKLLKNLDYAREIQKSMMPKEINNIKGIELCTGYYPAEHVTGDFFNVFHIAKGKIGFYLGDVSGHGIPAAMLSVFLNQSIKVIGEYNKDSMLNPAYVLNEVYSAFNKTNFTEEVYSVVLYGVIDLEKMELKISSAGLNVSPLIIRDNSASEIKVKGMPVIKFGEYITPFYENKIIKLEKGDRLFFYTDGVVEARNTMGDWYGDERLKDILLKNGDVSSLQMGEVLIQDVFAHIGENEINDDITYIYMKI